MTQTLGFFPVLLFSALIGLNYRCFVVFFLNLLCPPCCQSIFSSLFASSIYFTLRFLVSLTLKLMNLQIFQEEAVDQARLAHQSPTHTDTAPWVFLLFLSEKIVPWKVELLSMLLQTILLDPVFFFHFPLVCSKSTKDSNFVSSDPYSILDV